MLGAVTQHLTLLNNAIFCVNNSTKSLPIFTRIDLFVCLSFEC